MKLKDPNWVTAEDVINDLGLNKSKQRYERALFMSGIIVGWITYAIAIDIFTQ